MKTFDRTIYEAKDGKEFLDVESCIQWEKNCDQVDNLLRMIPENNSRHGEYQQLDKETFLEFRTKLLDLALDDFEGEHGQIRNWIKDLRNSRSMTEIHSSWAGRAISELCNSKINKAFYRVMCVDKNFREWDQPYYANESNKEDENESK